VLAATNIATEAWHVNRMFEEMSVEIGSDGSF